MSIAGVRVLEMAGLGPAPLAAMLADLGAEIIRVDRVRDPGAGEVRETLHAVMRGRRSVGIDLHQEADTAVLLRLVEDCDVLIDPFRPGVMERLGIGPQVCLARNPKLLFVRMTGHGQDGPLASKPGHDINYLAMAGVLAHLGPPGAPPPPPLSLGGLRWRHHVPAGGGAGGASRGAGRRRWSGDRRGDDRRGRDPDEPVLRRSGQRYLATGARA